MADTTDWGFPRGRVAKTLRSILYPNLTDHDVEAIVVCLMAHLLVESRLNDVLTAWLTQDAPKVPDPATEKANAALATSIGRMDFARKYSLIRPFFEKRSPDEAKSLWELNDLRTKVFHGHAIKDARFKGDHSPKRRPWSRCSSRRSSSQWRSASFRRLSICRTPWPSDGASD